MKKIATCCLGYFFLFACSPNSKKEDSHRIDNLNSKLYDLQALRNNNSNKAYLDLLDLTRLASKKDRNKESIAGYLKKLNADWQFVNENKDTTGKNTWLFDIKTADSLSYQTILFYNSISMVEYKMPNQEQFNKVIRDISNENYSLIRSKRILKGEEVMTYKSKEFTIVTQSLPLATMSKRQFKISITHDPGK